LKDSSAQWHEDDHKFRVASVVVVANAAALGGGAVTVNAGATLQFSSNLHGTVVLPGLTVLTGGTVDLSTTDLLIEYTGTNPYPATLSAMRSAYDSGHWDLAGIHSSAITAGTTLAIYDNSSNTQSTLDGVSVPAATTFIKYTWIGDANADGVVNATDLAMMQPAGTEWQQGDFNYDARVNADDYALFDLGLALSSGKNISTQLPEPISAVVIAAIFFAPRRPFRGE
jgi:hypothetical protein